MEYGWMNRLRAQLPPTRIIAKTGLWGFAMAGCLVLVGFGLGRGVVPPPNPETSAHLSLQENIAPSADTSAAPSAVVPRPTLTPAPTPLPPVAAKNVVAHKTSSRWHPRPTATRPSVTSTPAPATTSPTPTDPATGVLMYVTGYSFWDNTPPGSTEISHPVIHQEAGGAGTYADPVTVAVGHSIIDGKDVLDFKAGTRFYVPNLRKYFIVEDTCGDGRKPQNGPCHRLDTPGNRAPAGAAAWIDVWVGGEGSTDDQANDCMSELTQLQVVIVNPALNFLVVAGDISSGSTCKVGYGDKVVVAT